MDETYSSELRSIEHKIEDFDESELSFLSSKDDFDSEIAKLEAIRDSYYSVFCKCSESFRSDYTENVDNYKSKIKQYKHKILEFRHKYLLNGHLKAADDECKKEKKRTFGYSIAHNECQNLLAVLEIAITDKNFPSEDNSNLEIRNLKEMKSDVERNETALTESFDKLQTYFCDETDFEEIMHKYSEFKKLKLKWDLALSNQIKLRELNHESDKSGLLNPISVKKFTGSASDVDIYSFKREFERVLANHLAPKDQSQYLKSNLLGPDPFRKVEYVDEIREIWEILIEKYGGPQKLFQQKLLVFEKFSSVSGQLSNQLKSLEDISKFIIDFEKLLSEHLESEPELIHDLYGKDFIDKVVSKFNTNLSSLWVKKLIENDSCRGKRRYDLMKSFLVYQIKFIEHKIDFLPEEKRITNDKFPKNSRSATHYTHNKKLSSDNSNTLQQEYTFSEPYCFVCETESRHSAYVCSKFASMSNKDRYDLALKKHVCFQCMKHPFNYSKACMSNTYWCCAMCLSSNKSIHFALCTNDEHIRKNVKRLDHFFLKYPKALKEFSIHSNHISPSFENVCGSNFQSVNPCVSNESVFPDSMEHSIYLYQIISFYGSTALVFYDSGCSSALVSGQFAIGKNLQEKQAGPINISVAGGNSYVTHYGEYYFQLKDYKNRLHNLSAIGMESITAPVPLYNLSAAFDTLQRDDSQNLLNNKPLPSYVGGQPVTIMLGIKYGLLAPKLIMRHSSGLSLYESQIVDAFGSQLIVAGPHSSFTEVNKSLFACHNNFDSAHLLTDLFINFRHCQLDSAACITSLYQNENSITFEESEIAGTYVDYRCVDCRNCNKCKRFEKIEKLSINDEIEQDLIDKSVHVDLSSKSIIARLPFIKDPSIYLKSNKTQAEKVLLSQLKLPVVKKTDIVSFHEKLRQACFIGRLEDESISIQNLINSSPVKTYLPWRGVWKPGSTSTPCRMVFDATMTGTNKILAKGVNSINSLQKTFIKFRMHPMALTFDIKKMYNSIKLDVKDWCYQLFLWVENLDSENHPVEIWVIKTLIYGMKSSGGQAEFGLRETARLNSIEYPIASEVLMHSTYVDDGMSGSLTSSMNYELANDITYVLDSGGFKVKGFCFSGEKPSYLMSSDGEHVSVAGIRWFSECDILKLSPIDFDFRKRIRGYKWSNVDIDKCENIKAVLPGKLTRRMVVSKVAEIFDLTGLITPITASFKLDLHELVVRGLNWDDILPIELKRVWITNFETMSELKEISFQRAIVPIDAQDPYSIYTLEFGDASSQLICCVIYARFKLRNGSYSCQNVFSRSKLVHETVPRNELNSAVILSYASRIVRSAFGDKFKSGIKCLDSEITLHWIINESKRTNVYVRKRIVEINRLCEKNEWYHIESSKNPADLGTRKGLKPVDIDINSIWQIGFPWMCLEENEFPIKNYYDIKLNDTVIQMDAEESYSKKVYNYLSNFSDSNAITINQNIIVNQSSLIGQNYTCVTTKFVSDKIFERYQVHDEMYIVDPLRYGWLNSIRILALCIKFIRIITKKMRLNGKVFNLFKDSMDLNNIYDSKDYPCYVINEYVVVSDMDYNLSLNYFFLKASVEIRTLCTSSEMKSLKSINGILYYVGRILDGSEIRIISENAEKFDDANQLKLVKPAIDRYSPLAYALAMHVHWDILPHRGVTATLRESLKIAYILHGRSIFKEIRYNCKRCRYLLKQTLEVEMGSISQHQLTIAPAFYASLIDLAGPFKAFSPHNFRSVIKVWLCVFVCATTGATKIFVMDKYDSTAFVLAFERFSSHVCYPKYLLIDQGSQLLKASNDIYFNFVDLKNTLYYDKNCIVEVCPTQAHWMRGKVERRIRIIRESLERMPDLKQSLLMWETTCSLIANAINNQPIAVGNLFEGLDDLDILTPNRLLKGRNDYRCPIGPVMVSNDPKHFIESKNSQFDAWFRIWLDIIPMLMHRPKWFHNDDPPSVGDVVLFKKGDSELSGHYQYGIVDSVILSADGHVRSVHVKYKNASESVYRSSKHAVRDLVIISRIDEINLEDEFVKVLNDIDRKYQGDIT